MTGSSAPAPQRCSQSPLLRRKRDAAVASHQPCVQVQWRFLQHQNPAPPSFKGGAEPRQPSPAAASQRVSDRGGRVARSTSTASSPRASPSELFDRFASPRAEAEIAEERRRQYELQLQQQQRRAQRQCRVLDDILGETQRKAMLNRILADMEALALPSDARSPRQRPGQRAGVGAAHRPEEDAGVVVSAKHAGGITALRHNLSPSTALGANAISLLPQRRLSTLGSVEAEEPASGATLYESEGEDDEGEDDDDDNDEKEEEERAERESDERTRSDRGTASRPHQRTAERIAMAELRKLRRRHQRRQQRLGARGESLEHQRSGAASSHVFWQESSRVRLAHDIPPALLVPTQLVNAAAPPLRQPSTRLADGLSVGHEAAAAPPSDEHQSFSSLVRRRRRPFLSPTDSARSVLSGSPETASGRSASNAPREEPPPLSPVVSPRDAHRLQAPYGAWYLPQQQWWELHEKERQALAERFPAEARAAAAAPDERHCHHAAQQERCHKPPASSSGGPGAPSASLAAASAAGAGGHAESLHLEAWPSTLRREDARP